MEASNERVVKRYENSRRKETRDSLFSNELYAAKITSLCVLLSTLFFTGGMEVVPSLVGFGITETILNILGITTTVAGGISLGACLIMPIRYVLGEYDDDFNFKHFEEYIEYLFYKAYEETFLDKLKDYLIHNNIYDKYTINEEELLQSIQSDIQKSYDTLRSKGFIKTAFDYINNNNNIINNNNDIDNEDIEYSEYKKRKIAANAVYNKLNKIKEAIIKDKKFFFLNNVPERGFWKSVSISKPVEAIKSGWNSVKSWFGGGEQIEEKKTISKFEDIKQIEEEINGKNKKPENMYESKINNINEVEKENNEMLNNNINIDKEAGNMKEVNNSNSNINHKDIDNKGEKEKNIYI